MDNEMSDYATTETSYVDQAQVAYEQGYDHGQEQANTALDWTQAEAEQAGYVSPEMNGYIDWAQEQANEVVDWGQQTVNEVVDAWQANYDEVVEYSDGAVESATEQIQEAVEYVEENPELLYQ